MADAALSDRIEGIRQLGSVVRAMTGIAGARARTARSQIAAVEDYATLLATALQQATTGRAMQAPENATRAALIVFCAEQGFVGAFSERVLDRVGANQDEADLFLIGSRGAAVAAARGIVPVWVSAMPSHSASLPKFADRLLEAVFADARARAVSVIHTIWEHGQARVASRNLFPLPPTDAAVRPPASLTNISAPELAANLGLDRLHAVLTRAALHAFVSENEARMAAMSAASRHIATELDDLQALARRFRQEAITAEIIEIAAGAMAGR